MSTTAVGLGRGRRSRRKKSVVDGMEGLCILLRRLSYPCRYSDMISRFQYQFAAWSVMTSWILYITLTDVAKDSGTKMYLIQLHHSLTVTPLPTK